jgi:hypothetical protein
VQGADCRIAFGESLPPRLALEEPQIPELANEAPALCRGEPDGTSHGTNNRVKGRSGKHCAIALARIWRVLTAGRESDRFAS